MDDAISDRMRKFLLQKGLTMRFGETRVCIRAVAVGVLMFAIAGACSNSDSAPPNAGNMVRNINQALSTDPGTELSVSGFLFADKDGQVRLCEMLLESSPPQCGGDRILLSAFDADDTPNIQRVQQPSEINTGAWTNEIITITGTRNSDGLVDVTLAGN